MTSVSGVRMLAANDFNWVRADQIQPVSLEMLALLGGLFLVWRFRRSGLVALYAVSLPFNDVVYRLGPITVSDLLAIAILVARPPTTRPWLVTPLLAWICWGFFNTLVNSQSMYSFAYGLRFALVLLVMGTINLGRVEATGVMKALRAVTLLAALISLLQVVLWRLGLPINGVFAASGFIRPKGLSHEPSTSAAWFAMALPLLSVSRTRRGGFDWLLAVAITTGLMLTASLSGFVIVGVQAVFFVVRWARDPAHRRRLVLAAVVAIPAVLLMLGVVGSQATLLVDKAGQLVDEYASGVRPENIGDSSGREGDLVLLDAAPPSMLSGSGAFVAPEIAAGLEGSLGSYAPASNILITTAIETGIIGLALLLFGLGAVYVGARKELHRRLPSFVDGFAGFLAATLGQRMLAFPQPWLMLAVARGLNHDPDDHPPDSSDRVPRAAHSPETNPGDQDVNSDAHANVSAVSAVRRYPFSTAIITIVGIGLIVVGVSGRLQTTTVTVDLGRSGLNELAAGLDLPLVDAEQFEAQDEAFYINHAYSGVSASVAGEAVVVAAASRSGDDDAQLVLDAFLADYLPKRNADWIATFESGRERSRQLAERAGEEIATIDAQLAADGLDPAARSQLVLSRAQLESDRSAAEVDADSYSVMLERGGQIAVVGGPAEASKSSFLLIVGSALGILIVVLIAVGQAMWRSMRSTDHSPDDNRDEVTQ